MGANIEATNQNRRTSLLLAVKNGNIEMVEMLLEKGANIKMKDNNNVGVLHLAAMEGDGAMAKVLVKALKGELSEELDKKDNTGKTSVDRVLGYSGSKDTSELINALCFVSLALVDCNHKRGAFFFAVEKGHEKTVRLLVEDGMVDMESKARREDLECVYWMNNGKE